MKTDTLYYPEGWEDSVPMWTDSTTASRADVGPVRASAAVDPDQDVLAIDVRPATDAEREEHFGTVGKILHTQGLDESDHWMILDRYTLSMQDLLDRIESARG